MYYSIARIYKIEIDSIKGSHLKFHFFGLKFHEKRVIFRQFGNLHVNPEFTIFN